MGDLDRLSASLPAYSRTSSSISFKRRQETGHSFSKSVKMQLLNALVFAVSATLVVSQSASSLVAQLPSCAISCLASASTTNGCGISDYACQWCEEGGYHRSCDPMCSICLFA